MVNNGIKQPNKIEDAKLTETDTHQFRMVKIKEGQEMVRFYDLESCKKCLSEKKGINDHDPMVGPIPFVTIYYGEDRISSYPIMYSWKNYNFRHNRSPSAVKILNEQEVILSDLTKDHLYILHVETGKKKEIIFPENISDIYSVDIDQSRKFMVASMEQMASKVVYVYRFHQKEWTQVYRVEKESNAPGSWFVKSVWGIDGRIYFDGITEDHRQVILAHDQRTGETIKFKENAYILNVSPDKRFISYVDKTKDRTVIQDLVEESVFEITMTEELDWHPTQPEFAFVKDKTIRVGKIKENTLVKSHYDISSQIKINDHTFIYNLQFGDHDLRFDVVDFEIINDNVHRINKVKTYEIQF
ncbi:MAG: hypothetical protein H0Z33_07640 [Bacillaceae bacterium]|nr:hypothetical protein [Bacillaceae bacterium]